MDWSEYYPSLALLKKPGDNQGQESSPLYSLPSHNLLQVEFLDVGCGYGGLLSIILFHNINFSLSLYSNILLILRNYWYYLCSCACWTLSWYSCIGSRTSRESKWVCNPTHCCTPRVERQPASSRLLSDCRPLAITSLREHRVHALQRHEVFAQLLSTRSTAQTILSLSRPALQEVQSQAPHHLAGPQCRIRLHSSPRGLLLLLCILLHSLLVNKHTRDTSLYCTIGNHLHCYRCTRSTPLDGSASKRISSLSAAHRRRRGMGYFITRYFVHLRILYKK